jgi:hypothetical protein
MTTAEGRYALFKYKKQEKKCRKTQRIRRVITEREGKNTSMRNGRRDAARPKKLEE